MRLLNRTLIALAGLLAGAVAAEALTVDQAALRSARKRGYTARQTACFVPVFKTYASQNRFGKWVVSGRARRADIYRHEALTRCGVER